MLEETVSAKNMHIIIFKENQRGFTLIELLIALAIGAIVLLAAYNVFISQKKSHELQGQLVDAEQSARAALDLLTRELRLAGSLDLVTGGGTTRTTATLVSTANVGATIINVASSAGFSSNDIIYLINIPTANAPTTAERKTITNIAIVNNIPTFTLDSALTNSYTSFRTEIFKESSQAITSATENSIRFRAVSVLAAPNENQEAYVTYDFDSANKRIRRAVGNGNLDPFAENIDYFQIKYYDAKDFPIPNPAPNPYTGVNIIATTDRARIRKVNIQIVAITSTDETGHTETGTYGDGTTYANRGSTNRRRVFLESDILMTNMAP